MQHQNWRFCPMRMKQYNLLHHPVAPGSMPGNESTVDWFAPDVATVI